MSNRQKLYVSLAVSAGVCTGVALFLYLRHRRQTASSKSPNTNNTSSLTPTSIFSSIKSRHNRQYTDITTSSSEADHDGSETVRFKDGGATIEIDIPGGATSLTPEQAIILTQYLNENLNDIDQLNRVLTNIANAATYQENQINLTNAGCIRNLRELLLTTTTNPTTQSKILLALNNLALNEYTITHFSGIVPVVINLCSTSPSKSTVRLYGLNLLMNMSVLEYLHNEYMENLSELGLLIQSTFNNNDETLSSGKILVNLSANKSNLEYLLKLTGVEIKTILNICTPKLKHTNDEQTSKFEEILLRYVTFYYNLADAIIKELQQNKNWLPLSISYQQGTVYFELFDPDKQMESKTILRPQYSSAQLNTQIKRLRQSMDTIRQIQIESSVLSIQDEFNSYDRTDSSTPKKTPPITENNHNNILENFENEINNEFDEDDNTILADASTPSDQSLASFRSAYSTINENNTSTSSEQLNTT